MSIRPIHWHDRESIRQWRNGQLDVLRQDQPLTEEQQDTYFRDVILPQFDMEKPPQILLAFLQDGELIGYGGFVHISWSDLRAEVSFLSNPDRCSRSEWADDWRVFLGMIAVLARTELGLHRLTTETYAFRTDVLAYEEAFGFVREGVLREHHRIDGAWVDSIVCGLLLD